MPHSDREAGLLIDASRRRGEQAAQEVKEHYERLLDLTEQVVAQAQQVQQHLHAQAEQQADRLAQRLAETIETFVPRVEQVSQQTTRRVLQDEQVPASEKLVSLFEPHTAIIRKGKAGKPVEFGRVLWLGEVEGGIEGRISGLKRRHGLRRCRYHGDEGMARWVGWGVLAHDLRVIAQHEAAKVSRQG